MTLVSSTGPEAPNADLRRQAFILGATYLLQAARLAAAAIDRDLIQTLLFLAISRANVAGITDGPEASTRFAGLTSIPPDTMRLPISVYALSRDLRLPKDSVRRHVGKLKSDGLCIEVSGGLIIPRSVLMGPNYLMAIDQNWSLTRAFVDELARLGIFAPLQSDAQHRDVRRQTVRISVDYFVDGLSLFARLGGGNLRAALVLCAVSAYDLERHSPDDTLGQTMMRMGDIALDHFQEPIRIRTISALLLLPVETARRHLKELAQRGLVERRAGEGFAIPPLVEEVPSLSAELEAFGSLTGHLLERLAKIGVTDRNAVAVKHMQPPESTAAAGATETLEQREPRNQAVWPR